MAPEAPYSLPSFNLTAIPFGENLKIRDRPMTSPNFKASGINNSIHQKVFDQSEDLSKSAEQSFTINTIKLLNIFCYFIENRRDRIGLRLDFHPYVQAEKNNPLYNI